MKLLELISLPSLCALAFGAYLILNWVYNVFFHPLRSFPGPKLWAASFVPSIFHSLRGRLPYAISELHDKYDEAIRVTPNSLSFTSERAWEEIYGHIKGSHTKTFEKDYSFYGPTVSGAPNIIQAHEADHRRLRKLQSHAFSEKALSAQESYLQKYVRLFISRLYEQLDGPGDGVVPISMWYNFTAFDLIGDLAFAHSFQCLDSGELHPWVAITFGSIKVMEYMRIARIYPLLEALITMIIPKSMKDIRISHNKWSSDRAQERLKMGTERQDFMSYILRHSGEKGMSNDELNEAAAILILAGSETTATLLTGLTYHLLRRPDTYQKLTREIRSAFKTFDEMDVVSLSQLKYLNACLEEGLRMYPPAPSAHPRVAPAGGETVCGHFVPEGTKVGVSAWAASHSKHNFLEPDKYLPERWLGDPRFESDHRKASQAFSYGPRNCIGKNLAWAEMRLILGSLLWNFDLELEQRDEDWHARNKIFILWEKPELHVRLLPRAN